MKRWMLQNVRLCFVRQSSWNDGDSGSDWKSRDLSERRSIAIDTLVNVGRRQLISDAARDRAKRNTERLRESIVTENDRVEADDDLLIAQVEELLSDETMLDSLDFVPKSELTFLRDELYSLDSEDDKSIKRWMKLRSERENSFGSLPKEERTLWSAWYLRDVAESKGK